VVSRLAHTLSLGVVLLALACQPSSPPAAPHATPPPSTAVSPVSAQPEPTLRFLSRGRELRTLTRAELVARIPSVTFTQYDPYYAAPKPYRALPLAAVLEAGTGSTAAALAQVEWVLRASDGYAVPIAGARLLEDGAHLAIADVDVPDWAPIGPQRANPGPYYLVWSKDGQQDLETHPRPWQLASLEIAPFETVYPHTVPTGVAPDSPAARGFALFKQQCIRCHMINREGGKVGPELNVPQSVVEYRQADYLRAFIKNPWQFRYGAMPPMAHLTEADLDAVLAYFDAMRQRKHDPDAGKIVAPH
jgi:mono/diheme cytochrome c family protein